MSNADAPTSTQIPTPQSAQSAQIATDSPRELPRPSFIRHRDKPQLSCNACRRRKVRCDRQFPCSNCSSRGQESSCAYPTSREPPSGRPHSSGAHVQDRIDRLENLVLNLMQQQQLPASSSHGSPSNFPPVMPDESPSRETPTPSASDLERPLVARKETQREVPPSPSDYGTIRIQESGTSYVSSAHWVAVLDSIAQLRDHFAHEDQINAHVSDPLQLQEANSATLRPQLLYGCSVHVTLASILQAIPPRSVVDRLVSRYFNDLDMATGVVHRGKFLREYEDFWKAPQDARINIIWVSLLFTIMCLSTQFQQLFLAPGNASPAQENQTTVDRFREKSIQCLILGHYAKGGPYVLEALILYFLVEVFPLKELEIGMWILVGNIIQIATFMGYHRDAIHFATISPFEGEMRRRVWSMIIQIDVSISTQLGLSRLVKESQTNTAEPRNLADSDFYETMSELPPSRPETEVTPILYTLAKLRIISVGVKVADLATETRSYSYVKVLELDQQISEAQDALPSCMKWESLSSSLTSPPLVIIQRIWLDICVQRLKMVLHKKFLVPSFALHQQYAYSRSACLNAAMRILEFHHLVDEETQVDGRLFQIRWRVSTALTHEFLLATSVLCFYLQVHAEEREQQERHDSEGDTDVGLVNKIRQLLRISEVIWLRLSAASTEARKAAAAIRYVLGDSGMEFESFESVNMMSNPNPATAVSYYPGFLDLIPSYNFPSLGSEQINEGTSWANFVPNMNNDIEQWVEDNTSPQTDLTL